MEINLVHSYSPTKTNQGIEDMEERGGYTQFLQASSVGLNKGRKHANSFLPSLLGQVIIDIEFIVRYRHLLPPSTLHRTY